MSAHRGKADIAVARAEVRKSEHSAAPGRFSNSSKAAPMEAEILASTILGAFEEARSQLIGKSAVLTGRKGWYGRECLA